jgi:hypothetical protein
VHSVSLTPHARFLRSKIDHIEFEAEFKKALARESGAQGVLFDEKKPKVENLVTLSLSIMMRIESVLEYCSKIWRPEQIIPVQEFRKTVGCPLKETVSRDFRPPFFS